MFLFFGGFIHQKIKSTRVFFVFCFGLCNLESQKTKKTQVFLVVVYFVEKPKKTLCFLFLGIGDCIDQSKNPKTACVFCFFDE